MFHIVFAWELGGGLGHLVRYRALVARLLADGHAVTFVVRNAASARTVFAGMAVAIREAPCGETPEELRLRPPNSFAEVLYNCGFHAPAPVTERVQTWLALLRELAPAILVADYSPSALIANRRLGIPAIMSGNGFYNPPAVVPLPPIRYWQAADRARLLRSEEMLLANINAALAAIAAPPAASVMAALASTERFLMSFREFDHYPEREGIDYLGTYPSEDFGIAPRWPAVAGRKVFAYLNRSVLLPEILVALAACNAAVCLYAPGLEPAAVPPAAAARVAVMAAPVDLAVTASQCDAVVTNANLNSMTAFLLAGKPQLAVPYTLEKYQLARCLELLGAGLAAPRTRPGDLVAKLRAVLTQRDYRRAAEQFAARYAGGSQATQAVEMQRRIYRLLEPGRS